MSVGFANAVVDGLRYNGVKVTFEPGWETRGNGFKFPNGMPEGLIEHHTGSAFDTGLSILINGRPDLDPPLCNCCTKSDGTIHIIAAHCANHAGASGGPSMGPLPVTTLFNPRVWGNEIMFPGITPWTAAQYRSARVLGGVISGILNRKSPEWVRGHYETSTMGKWDPGAGKGSGKSFDMNVFRREIWSALKTPVTVGEPMLKDVDIVGTGRRVITVTSGSASGIFGDAWLSATVLDVTGPVNIRVFVQSDKGGLIDWTWTEAQLKQAADNNYKRVVRQLPDGATKAIVSWDVTKSAGGVVCLELKPKS